MQDFFEFLVNSEQKEYGDEVVLAWVYTLSSTKKMVQFIEKGFEV